MLRHKPRNKVVHFPLPACDGHAAIVGEWKANVKDFRRSARPKSAMAQSEGGKRWHRSGFTAPKVPT
jgi:hypothetical protein